MKSTEMFSKVAASGKEETSDKSNVYMCHPGYGLNSITTVLFYG